MLGVKCAVDRGAQFLFVSGPPEWSGIARDMKHILVVVEVPGKGTGGVKRESSVKNEDAATSQRTYIVISDDSDTEAGDAVEPPDAIDGVGAMDVEGDGDGDDGTNTITGSMVSEGQHRQVMHDWLIAHPDAPWVVPPADLAPALRGHIKKLESLSDSDKRRLSLPALVLNRLSPSGEKWLAKQIVHTKPSGHRRVLVDDRGFYDILVQAHRGSSGSSHTIANTMRKNIGKKYSLAPKVDFYEKWVASCPGCHGL
ncbi:hypothetical protein PENSPDRAFT_656812 [Peniophora sp. CONT]|nr:hypothetical protein PENSPDRAFT_656812 [Peniophora sp. CONT]